MIIHTIVKAKLSLGIVLFHVSPIHLDQVNLFDIPPELSSSCPVLKK